MRIDDELVGQALIESRVGRPPQGSYPLPTPGVCAGLLSFRAIAEKNAAKGASLRLTGRGAARVSEYAADASLQRSAPAADHPQNFTAPYFMPDPAPVIRVWI